MTDELLICTGHRPDKIGCPPHPMAWMPAIKYLASVIDTMSHWADGRQAVITGMAEGFDLMMGAATLMAKDAGVSVRLIAAVPFEGDTAFFRRPLSVKWHARILERADEVVIVSKTRGEYRARNQWMIDQPAARGTHGLVWACWNGNYGKPGGGTGQTVRMAQAAGLVVDDSFFRIVREELGLQDRRAVYQDDPR